MMYSETAVDPPLIAKYDVNISAPTRTMKITDVVVAVSRNTSLTIEKESFRRTMAMMNAPAAPRAPASVGVNTPA